MLSTKRLLTLLKCRTVASLEAAVDGLLAAGPKLRGLRVFVLPRMLEALPGVLAARGAGLRHVELRADGDLGGVGVERVAEALGGLPRLERLELRLALCDAHAACVAAALLRLAPRLRELTLHASFEDAGWRCVLAAVGQCRTLRRLCFEPLEDRSSAAQHAMGCLAGLASLAALDVVSHDMDYAGYAALAEALPTMRSLTQLSIQCPGAASVRALQPALRALTRLATLSVLTHPEDDDAGDAGDVGVLLDAVHAPSLRTLCLESLYVDDSLASLGRLVELRVFTMLSCSVDAARVPALASALRGMTRLVELGLSDAEIDAAGAAALAPALAQMTSVQTLDLSHNKLGAAGAAALAAALPQMVSLRNLNVAANETGPVGAALVATALSLTHMAPRELKLSSNAVGHDADALCHALARMTSLETLNISNNNLGPKGAAALAHALTRLSALNVLDVQCNNLGPLGIATLAPALLSLTQISSLRFAGNDAGQLGADAMAIIKPQLPTTSFYS
jgi:hypothetical protein